MDTFKLSFLVANIRGGCANEIRREYGIVKALGELCGQASCILVQESWTDLPLQLHKDTPYHDFSEVSCGFGHLGPGNGLKVLYDNKRITVLESKAVSSRLLLFRTKQFILINAYAPQRNIGIDTKRAFLNELEETVSEYSEKFDNIPIIVAGDINISAHEIGSSAIDVADQGHQ